MTLPKQSRFLRLQSTLAALLSLIFIGSSLADTTQVTFISPDPPAGGFWTQYAQVMQAAASDLEISLTTVNATDRDRFEYVKAVERVIRNAEKPDFMVVMFRNNTTVRLLEMLESLSIPYLSVNIDIPAEERASAGLPRQRFRHWLGHITPDDYAAGRLLAQSLLSGPTPPSEAPQTILALTGARDSAVSFQRLQGLTDYLKDPGDAILAQSVFTDWRYDTTRAMVLPLISRHPKASLIWCASDALASAVIDELQANGIRDKYRIASIDWTDRGLYHYVHGELDVAVGGHFLEGAVALALLKDYAQGVDFIERLGQEFKIPMGDISAQDDKQIIDIILHKDWEKLDFKRLSVGFGGHPVNAGDSYLSILQRIVTPSPISEMPSE